MGWSESKDAGHSLARVALPPDGRDADLRRLLHHLTVGHAGAVQHGLGAGEVMAAGDGGGPAVEVAARWDAGELDVVLGRLGVVGRGGALGGHCRGAAAAAVVSTWLVAEGEGESE